MREEGETRPRPVWTWLSEREVPVSSTPPRSTPASSNNEQQRHLGTGTGGGSPGSRSATPTSFFPFPLFFFYFPSPFLSLASYSYCAGPGPQCTILPSARETWQLVNRGAAERLGWPGGHCHDVEGARPSLEWRPGAARYPADRSGQDGSMTLNPPPRAPRASYNVAWHLQRVVELVAISQDLIPRPWQASLARGTRPARPNPTQRGERA